MLLDISKLLESKAMEWVGAAFVIVMASLWIIVSCFHIEAVWKGRCLVSD